MYFKPDHREHTFGSSCVSYMCDPDFSLLTHLVFPISYGTCYLMDVSEALRTFLSLPSILLYFFANLESAYVAVALRFTNPMPIHQEADREF